VKTFLRLREKNHEIARAENRQWPTLHRTPPAGNFVADESGFNTPTARRRVRATVILGCPTAMAWLGHASLLLPGHKDVDGRDEPGHDDRSKPRAMSGAEHKRENERDCG
jgi:hypothetical protein